MTSATAKAAGSKADCAQGFVRFPFTLSESELEQIKAAALKNRRSISSEIRSRLQATLSESERAAS